MVDSGFNEETVFKSIIPLLEPLITPETVQIHPVRELYELCTKQDYTIEKPLVSKINGKTSVTVRVEANGIMHEKTSMAEDRKAAQKLASKEVLMSLKKPLLN